MLNRVPIMLPCYMPEAWSEDELDSWSWGMLESVAWKMGWGGFIFSRGYTESWGEFSSRHYAPVASDSFQTAEHMQ
jgi:hypothetical protein